MHDRMKKNVPWHILAPSAVACDMFLLRASAHPRGAFFCFIGRISYEIKKECQPGTLYRFWHSFWLKILKVFLA